MKKHLYAALLTVAMLINLVIGFVFAASAQEVPADHFLENKDTGITYGSLQEAFNEAQDGETIRLLKSQTLVFDEETDFSKQSSGVPLAIAVLDGIKNADDSYVARGVTFDLNGYTLTCNITYTGGGTTVCFTTENLGKLTLMDSSATQTGKIDVHSPSKASPIAYVMLSYAETSSLAGTLIVKSGTYTVDYVASALIYSQFASDETKGVWVQDGTFAVLGEDYDLLSSPWIFNASGGGHGTGNSNYVTGGTFNSDINHQSNRFEVDVYPQYALKSDENGEWWTVVPAFCYVSEKSGSYYDAIGYSSLKEALARTDSETVPRTAFGNAVNIYGDFNANSKGNNFDDIESRNYTVNINFSDHTHADSLIKDNCTITGDLVIPENVTVNIYKNVNILGTLTNYGTINLMDETAALNVYGQMVNHGTVHFTDGSAGACINAYGKVVNAKDITADSALAQDAVIIRRISMFGNDDGQFGVTTKGEFVSDPASTVDSKISVSKDQTFYETSSDVLEETISNPAAMLKHGDTHTLYADLAQACADAQEGDTVILLKNGSGADLVPKDSVVITINLNQWNLTAGENCYVFDYRGGVDAEGWSGVAYVVSDKTSDDLKAMVEEREVKSAIGQFFNGWNNTGNLFSATWKANSIEKIEYELKNGEHTYTIIMTDGTETTFTVSSLEEKLQELTSKLTTASEKIDVNEINIKALTDNVAILMAYKNEAQSAIAALQAMAGAQGTDISELKTAVASLEAAMNAANAKITDAEARIATLEGKVAALENAMAAFEAAKTELQNAINNKADAATVNDALAALHDTITALEAAKDDYVAADDELKTELEAAIEKAKQEAIEIAKQFAPYIGANGNWWIGSTDTGVDASGISGIGIEKIEKTATNGNIDTYTITLTNGNIFTFSVTNGQSGTNGKDGITPKLHINSETHQWEISYDDGLTWSSLGVTALIENTDAENAEETASAEAKAMTASAVVAGTSLAGSSGVLGAWLLLKKKKKF